MQVLTKPSNDHYLPFIKDRLKLKSLSKKQPNVYL